MAKNEIQNGQAEYGIVHVQEEEMRAAQQGVFETHSREAGRKPTKATKPDGAPAPKAASRKAK